jgi:glycosyltransferase involved in cell wall biosynthesis
MSPPLLSICVPVYNEAENLPLLHEAIARVIDPLGVEAEIILVDDGSKDDSWKQIQALVEKDARVRGIKFVANCGETAASDVRHDDGRGFAERSDGHSGVSGGAGAGVGLRLRDAGENAREGGQLRQSRVQPHRELGAEQAVAGEYFGRGVHVSGVQAGVRGQAQAVSGAAPVYSDAAEDGGVYGDGDSGEQ